MCGQSLIAEYEAVLKWGQLAFLKERAERASLTKFIAALDAVPALTPDAQALR